MASASAPASELAVQLSAPASSLAVPPPAASTAEAVDLTAGAVILEDPGPAADALDVCLYLTYTSKRPRRYININILEVVAFVYFSPLCL